MSDSSDPTINQTPLEDERMQAMTQVEQATATLEATIAAAAQMDREDDMVSEMNTDTSAVPVMPEAPAADMSAGEKQSETVAGAAFRTRLATLLGAVMNQGQRMVVQVSGAAATTSGANSDRLLETVVGAVLTTASASRAGAQASGQIDHETVARVSRGLTLIGMGLNALLAQQTTVDTPSQTESAAPTQQKDRFDQTAASTDTLADVTRDIISVTASAIVEAVEHFDQRRADVNEGGTGITQQMVTTPALDAQSVPPLPTSTEEALPPRRQGRYGRWFGYGLLVGAWVAFFTGRRDATLSPAPSHIPTPAPPAAESTTQSHSADGVVGDTADAGGMSSG